MPAFFSIAGEAVDVAKTITGLLIAERSTGGIVLPLKLSVKYQSIGSSKTI